MNIINVRVHRTLFIIADNHKTKTQPENGAAFVVNILVRLKRRVPGRDVLTFIVPK